MNFTWRGSRLTKLIVDGEYAIQYEYNDDGTRRRKLIKETKTENGVSKTIDDVIYSYVGGQLQSETHSKGYQLQYFYGLDGRLSFFIYRKDNVETRYYYRWDLLGITGIIDKDGNEVANYSYDAYGNMQIIHLDDTIGAINPMRYKGYYYDNETKYYWLNSRYYVPSWRRFLNPDCVEYLRPNNVDGLNLYAFFINNSLINNESSSLETDNVPNNPSKRFAKFFNYLGAVSIFFEVFSYVDQWSGFFSGGAEYGFEFFSNEIGLPSYGNYAKIIKKFSTAMLIVGAIMSWLAYAYDNYQNPNYSEKQKKKYTALDGLYCLTKVGLTLLVGKGTELASLWVAGIAMTMVQKYLGATLFTSMLLGSMAAFFVGLIGAILLYLLLKYLDNWYEEKRAKRN